MIWLLPKETEALNEAAETTQLLSIILKSWGQSVVPEDNSREQSSVAFAYDKVVDIASSSSR